MTLRQVRQLTAMLLIGDGMYALVRPHRDAHAWNFGPLPWQRLIRALGQRPGLLRAIGASQAALALWWALRDQPPADEVVSLG